MVLAVARGKLKKETIAEFFRLHNRKIEDHS